ncbi:MAG: ABC transporter permease subunit [Candidatus Bathyarchaeia archaeon]
MRKALIIAKKEIREIRGSKYLLSSLLMPIIIFGIAMPGAFAFISQLPIEGQVDIPNHIAQIIPGYGRMNDQQRMLYFSVYYLLGPMLLITPLMVPVFIAADSFAGERERKTIEPLLASPVSDIELFLGKVLTAFVPSMFISFIAFVIATCLFNWSALQVFGYIIFPDIPYFIMMIVLTPLATIFSISIVVLISARVVSVRDASQIGGVVIVPLILLIVGQMFAFIFINIVTVIIATAILALLDAILIRFCASRFGRETILMRL